MKKTQESPLVRIDKNRYISLFHVDKLGVTYRGTGRPRNKDYALDGIDRATRTKLVAMKKRYMSVSMTKKDSKLIAHPNSYLKAVLGIVSVVLLLGYMIHGWYSEPTLVPVAHAQEVKNKITTDDSLLPTETNVKQYLAIKFGFDAPKAWGVIRAESNRNWKYGDLLNTQSVYKTPFECSVGLFQINLADGHCDGKWIHAYKVAGETIQDKIEALFGYKYNIDTAYEIYKRQGFKPWTTFADGRSKQYEKEF